MMLDTREADLLALLRREGPLSRWELHQRTGLRANTVGDIAAGLIDKGVLREGASSANGRGRPRVPLEIDPGRRQVLGVVLEPGRIEYCRMSLHGQRVGPVSEQRCRSTESLINKAARLLTQIGDDRLTSIGVSVPGFIDLDQHAILPSTLTSGRRSMSLQPLYDAVAQMELPLVIENDMHALAAQWSLTHQADAGDDILLVSIRDGSLGAAMLIEGRPNRGCVGGGNDLGHNRFFVDTERCFCGHTGCLERICSTPFLRRRDPDSPTIAQAVAGYDGGEGPVFQIIDYLSAGLANATNFVRPNRLVIASPFVASAPFAEALWQRTHDRLLGVLAERVSIELWEQPPSALAEAAGWLGLTALYRTGWGMATL